MATERTRVQLTVPPPLFGEWEERAKAVGVPLSSWVVMMVQRPDASMCPISGLLTQTKEK